jgi:glycosyltransferase involved in cell wall biosynthesis
MLCRALGGPTFSFTVHGPEEFDKAGLLSLSAKLRNALFTIAVSDFGRSQLWRHCPASDWSKVHVIRCGVDRAFTQAACEGVPETQRLVCVGRLCEQKGQLLLVEAAAELSRGGQRFELVLVGDGELRGELEAAISRHGLREHVTITGWQSAAQVRSHIQGSRAFVLPSFAEGLPVVIMEALALCRPVISTWVAGIPELVTDGVHGWLTPAGALQPLVAAMRDALTAAPARLGEMGRAGRARVLDAHDGDRNARALNVLFADAVEG